MLHQFVGHDSWRWNEGQVKCTELATVVWLTTEHCSSWRNNHLLKDRRKDLQYLLCCLSLLVVTSCAQHEVMSCVSTQDCSLLLSTLCRLKEEKVSTGYRLTKWGGDRSQRITLTHTDRLEAARLLAACPTDGYWLNGETDRQTGGLKGVPVG